MIFFLELFLVFLYFKIARVEYKEEKHTTVMHLRNFLFVLSAAALFVYGFAHYSWYVVVGVAYLFFILAALLVTAVQVGIFIDGAPFVKLSHLRMSMWGILFLVIVGCLYLLYF